MICHVLLFIWGFIFQMLSPAKDQMFFFCIIILSWYKKPWNSMGWPFFFMTHTQDLNVLFNIIWRYMVTWCQMFKHVNALSFAKLRFVKCTVHRVWCLLNWHGFQTSSLEIYAKFIHEASGLLWKGLTLYLSTGWQRSYCYNVSWILKILLLNAIPQLKLLQNPFIKNK